MGTAFETVGFVLFEGFANQQILTQPFTRAPIRESGGVTGSATLEMSSD